LCKFPEIRRGFRDLILRKRASPKWRTEKGPLRVLKLSGFFNDFLGHAEINGRRTG
jgi:hypothetical protein